MGFLFYVDAKNIFIIYNQNMTRSSLAKKSLFTVLLIAGLHFLAETFYWYVSIWYFDNLMHFLGGLFLSLFSATVLYNYLKNKNSRETFFLIMFFVILIGIGWELFEYAVQFFIKNSHRLADITDSFFDMVFDILGGALGILFVLKSKSRYNIKHE